MLSWVVAALLVWAAACALIVIAFAPTLFRLWRDPVFRVPTLVLESDDWGAGPLAQADALRRIAQVLQRHRDAAGRAPVMSLALVLAVPDGPSIRTEGRYRALERDDPRFAPLLAALRAGAASGVFSLQLHGLEHYWPATLMASGDPVVQGWLRSPVPASTEQLPPHLQSRWVDASVLPSGALPAAEMRAAVAAEVAAYARIVGEPPRIVVPPTFVWTRAVEQAWAAAGLRGVVTPGWRYPGRDAEGRPGGDEGPIVNGERAGELCYLVRTDYFEPTRGRGARHALGVFDRAVAEGRPCVLENHRDNFIHSPAACEASLCELDALAAGALEREPRLRFMSTRELERIVRERDADWICTRARDRLPCVWQRLRHSGRPWKLLKLCGLAAVGGAVLSWVTRPAVAPGGGAGS